MLVENFPYACMKILMGCTKDVRKGVREKVKLVCGRRVGSLLTCLVGVRIEEGYMMKC